MRIRLFESADIRRASLERPACVNTGIDQRAAVGRIHEIDRGKPAISPARKIEFPFVETDEIRRSQLEPNSERVVGDIASRSIQSPYIGEGTIAEIVNQLVLIAIDVGAVVREPAEHIEIRAVTVRRVVEPITTARVMVGVETGALVADGETVSDHVTRDGIRQIAGGRGCIAPGLESMAVAEVFSVDGQAVIERPTGFERHGLVCTNAIETIVTIQPRAAATEDVSRAPLVRVAAEPIDVSASPAL